MGRKKITKVSNHRYNVPNPRMKGMVLSPEFIDALTREVLAWEVLNGEPPSAKVIIKINKRLMKLFKEAGKTTIIKKER